jgi:hypothetical protein
VDNHDSPVVDQPSSVLPYPDEGPALSRQTTEPALAPSNEVKKGFKHHMQQNIAMTPRDLYTFVVIIMLTLAISVLVVWPAVWSGKPARRQAAYRVLDRILKFFRPGRGS